MMWVSAVFQTLRLSPGLSGEQGVLITTMVALCLSGLLWLADRMVSPRAQEAPSLTPAVWRWQEGGIWGVFPAEKDWLGAILQEPE